MADARLRSLAHAIAHWGAARPDAPAFVAIGQPDLSWGEFARGVARHAAGLRALGITRSDRVAILMPHSRQGPVASIATATAAAAVPLDPEAPESALAALAQPLRPALVLAAPSLASRAAALGCPVIVADPAADFPLAAEPPSWPEPDPDPDDIAFIITTSGSTGEPRLVPRHHGMVAAGSVAYCDAFGLGPDDRCLIVTRPPFVISLSPAVIACYSGGATAFGTTLEFSSLAGAIRELRPTWMIAAPSWLRLAIDAIGGERSESSVRLVISAGAALEPGLAPEIARVFRATVGNDYGMAESMNIGFHVPQPGAVAAECPALRPVSAGNVAILREDGGFPPPPASLARSSPAERSCTTATSAIPR